MKAFQKAYRQQRSDRAHAIPSISQRGEKTPLEARSLIVR